MGLENGTHLVVEVSGVRFAVPAASVAELVLVPRLARLPAGPPAVEGVMNLRGQAVPVVALARLLGLRPSPVLPFTPVVVLKSPEPPWAVLVDRAVDVTVFDRLVPAPADASYNDCVQAGAACEGEWLPVISAQRLLSRRERQVLDQLLAAAGDRLAAFGETEAGDG